MTLVRWKPANRMFNVTTEFDRMVDRFFSPDMFNDEIRSSRWLPNMDVIENEDGFSISVELPGLEKKDVNVTLEDSVLTIKGERKNESHKDGTNYHRVERHSGEFVRSFKIPTTVRQDKINASFKNGVLTIDLPKAEEVKPKSIEVKVS